MNIRIVNKHDKNYRSTPWDIYVGRPSALGNPFPIEKFGRELSIRKYEEEFQRLMRTAKDTEHFNYNKVEAQLNLIMVTDRNFERVNLVCFCAPMPCHASAIVNYFDQMDLIDRQIQEEDLLGSGHLQPEDL